MEKLPKELPPEKLPESSQKLSRPPLAGAVSRINKDLKELQSNMVDFSISPAENDIFCWTGFIYGPKGSFYEDGIFNIQLDLPFDYPYTAPTVTFNTKIYHPNVIDGKVCLNILGKEWNPVVTILQILLGVQSLLIKPEFDHQVIDRNKGTPISHIPTITGQTSLEEFGNIARKWTRQYATMDS